MTTPPMKRAYTASSRSGPFPVRSTAMVPLKITACPAGLCGTWFGDSGVYTDVVAKWGRDDTQSQEHGVTILTGPSYRTRSESLSVELGKTFTRDDGLFLEPDAQMVFGRLGSKDYTTSRGRTVHMGGYDSAIGRLGSPLWQTGHRRKNIHMIII